MIVVSDASPILNLARIGRIDLLHSLYREVLIPTAVREELEAERSDLPVVIEFSSLSWIVVASPANRVLVSELNREIDRGEAEAVALAMERHSDVLLIDERRGRRVAARCGIPVIGLLGVLLEARAAGMIVSVKPLLDELIHSARFWIGDDLYRIVLERAKEI